MHHLYGFNVITIYDKTFKGKIFAVCQQHSYTQANTAVLYSYVIMYLITIYGCPNYTHITGTDPREVDAVHGWPPTMSFKASSFLAKVLPGSISRGEIVKHFLEHMPRSS